jgi:hypothetical protein
LTSFCCRPVLGVDQQVERLDHRRLADLVGAADHHHTAVGELDLAVGDAAVVRQHKAMQFHAMPLVDQAQQQRERRAGVVGVLTVGPRGADQFVDRGRREPADTEVVELAVGGNHRDVGLLVPRHQGREQPGVLVEAGIQRGLVGHGQRPVEPQPHDGALLVGHQVEVDVEVGDVAAAVDGAAERDEAPTADALRVDPQRSRGSSSSMSTTSTCPGSGSMSS